MQCENMVITGDAPNAVLCDAKKVLSDEIEVPAGIAVINNGAFAESKARKIVLNEGVKEIRYRAFADCANLSEIVLPSSLETVGEAAFSRCGLVNLVLPRGVKRIEKRAFAFCKKLRNVELPDTLEFVGEGAFLECFAFKRVYIPASVKVIMEDAFAKSPLIFNNEKLEIFCEGEVPDGWVEIEEMRDVERVETVYDSPRNFHTSSGSWDSVRHTVNERVVKSWNPDKYKVHVNVSRRRFREICKEEVEI